ncbi:MAG: serine hydrolase [Gemmatimonadetes bacterium]|nr:serine hydrolase [Gemmatimonadota bacterium]
MPSITRLGLLLSLAAPLAAQVPGWDRGLDAELEAIRKDWRVPGLAVAVVAKGKVIHARGYGLRDVERQLPVERDTKFAIASISKSFAVTSIAALVREGKVEWDGQVREYLPEFRMIDPVLTERMTIRDLVTMRSGLARHDLMWGIGVFTRPEIVARLRYLQPNRDFRTTWQYQNLMYTTAGYVAGRVFGSSWEDLVQARVLGPLGMTQTSPSFERFISSSNIALPYALHDSGQLMPVPWRSTDAIAPTGGLHSTLDDMVRYLTMHMQGGVFEGREIIARADARAMQTPQMAMQRPMTWDAGEFPELSDEAYGMGLLVTHYRGHKMVHHSGNWDGYSLELSFLPNDSVGVVVLTNMYSTTLRDFLPWLLYDRLLGLPGADWNRRFLERARRSRATLMATRAREDSLRTPGTSPSHPLDAYTGTYTHPAYGQAVVSRDGAGLRLRLGNYEFPLPHYHYDVFRLTPPVGNPVHNRFRFLVRFEPATDGSIGSVAIPMEPTVPPIIYQRARP